MWPFSIRKAKDQNDHGNPWLVVTFFTLFENVLLLYLWQILANSYPKKNKKNAAMARYVIIVIACAQPYSHRSTSLFLKK